MPVVFVHGVPDTHRVWNRVLEHLERDDVVTPDLPGFGCPVPEGFGATKDEYLDWLVDEVEELREPVDLVGHDWGSLLTMRLAGVRPDLVRTWAAGSGPVHPEWEWHEMAKLWQTPEVGEQVMEAFTSESYVRSAPDLGLPDAEARVAAEFIDETMRDCILRLYRSAIDVASEWGSDIAKASGSALTVWGADDAFAPARFAGLVAESVGGESLVFDDCGHWWPIERPAEVARALEDLWARG